MNGMAAVRPFRVHLFILLGHRIVQWHYCFTMTVSAVCCQETWPACIQPCSQLVSHLLSIYFRNFWLDGVVSQKSCSTNILTKCPVNLVCTVGYYLPLQVLDIKNSTGFCWLANHGGLSKRPQTQIPAYQSELICWMAFSWLKIITLLPSRLYLHTTQKRNKNKTENLARTPASVVILWDSVLSRFFHCCYLVSVLLRSVLFSPPGLPANPLLLTPPPSTTPPYELRSGAKYTWPWQTGRGHPVGARHWHLGSLAWCQHWQCLEGLAGITVFGWRSLWCVQIGDVAAKRREQRPGLFIWGSNTHTSTHRYVNTHSKFHTQI